METTLTQLSPDAAGDAPSRAADVRPAAGQDPGSPRRRSLYIDSLRAIALIQVFTLHNFVWGWLMLAFPSMGILFALAGSLMAASLDRRPGEAARVVGKRIRRFLPPLWLLGVVLVPVMLLTGWTSATAGTPLTWQSALTWILPIETPPGSDLGADWVIPLWYIRTYLWFVILAPMTWWLYRHRPLLTFALAPLVAILATLGVNLVNGPTADVTLTLSIFGACWLVGYAHYDGTLQAMRKRAVVPLALGLSAAGLVAGWLFHAPGLTWWETENTPMAEALYGLGFTVLLLRFNPSLEWVQRRTWLTGVISMINSRAMTIYLWGNFAIWASWAILDGPWEDILWEINGVGVAVQLLLAVALVVLAMFTFGWAEDLAAQRPLRINPWPRRRPDRAGTSVGTAPAPVAPASDAAPTKDEVVVAA